MKNCNWVEVNNENIFFSDSSDDDDWDLVPQIGGKSDRDGAMIDFSQLDEGASRGITFYKALFKIRHVAYFYMLSL